jgi:DNA-binding Xre family transcriptional regulator
MTNPSQPKKTRRRLTHIATPEGLQAAEAALKKLGFYSKTNFAKSALIARNTVTKFFLRQPIELDSFQRICKYLNLRWEDIAELEELSISVETEKFDCSSPEAKDAVEKVAEVTKKITVIDRQTKAVKAEIILKGDRKSVDSDLQMIFESLLQKFAGETIKIINIQEGSIKLIVEGSQQDIEWLVYLIKLGKITEISGFPVEDVQKSDDKWPLVQEIVSQPVSGRKLSGADLSDADLSYAILILADLSDADLSCADLSDANLSDANLSDADLSRADLSRADLSRANLSRANLSNAKLSFANLNGVNLSGANLSGVYLGDADLINANLRDADLSGVYLRGADLSGADLSGAKVENAGFGYNPEISASMKQDLVERGAIFGDSPRDFSEVLVS